MGAAVECAWLGAGFDFVVEEPSPSVRVRLDAGEGIRGVVDAVT